MPRSHAPQERQAVSLRLEVRVLWGCVLPASRDTIVVSMAKEDDIFNEAVKRSRRVNATGGVIKETTEARADFITELLRRIYRLTNEQGKPVSQLYSEKTIGLFDSAIKNDAKARLEFRSGVRRQGSYPTRTVDEAQSILVDSVSVAERTGAATDIIKSRARLTQPITMELAARIAVMPPELQNNPRALYFEAARAYQSVDWQKMTPAQADMMAKELKSEIEDVFDRMKLNESVSTTIIPDKKQLWRGLGDYYLTAEVSAIEQLPPAPTTGASRADALAHQKLVNSITTRNQQREALQNRLREIQDTINRPGPTTDTLEKAYRELEKDIYQKETVIKSDSEPILQKLDEEIKQLKEKGPLGTRRPTTRADESPALTFEKEAQIANSRSPDSINLLHEIDPQSVQSLFPGNTQLQTELLKLSNLFTATPEEQIYGIPSDRLYQGREVIKQIKRDFGGLPPDQRELISHFERRIEDQVTREMQFSRQESSIYLDPASYTLLLKAPVALATKEELDASRRLLVSREDVAGETSLTRLRNIHYILFSESFDEKRIKMGSAEIARNLSTEEIETIRKARRSISKAQKEKFSRSYTTVFNAIRFSDLWSNAAGADDEMFQRFVNQLKDEDYFALDGAFGELIARIRERVRTNMEFYMANENGQVAATDPKFLEMSMRDTVDEIRKDKELEEMFGHYLDGEYFKATPFDPHEPNTLKAVGIDAKDILTWRESAEMLTKLSVIRMQMNMEMDIIECRYLPPAFGSKDGSYPMTFNVKEKVAKLVHWVERDMMQWGSKSSKMDNDRLMIRKQAQLMIDLVPELSIAADERTDKLWGKIERLRDLRRTEQNMDKKEKLRLFAEISNVCYFIPNRDFPPPNYDASNPSTFPEFEKWLLSVDKKFLQKEALIFEGMRRAQSFGTDPYLGMHGSGFRRSHEGKFQRDALTEVLSNTMLTAYSEVMGMTPEQTRDRFMKGRFLSATIVGSARKYDMNIMAHHLKVKAGNEHVANMADVSMYRSHSVAMILWEGESRSFTQWCTDHIGGIQNYRETFKKISTNFDAIHATMEKNWQFQPDYYAADYAPHHRQLMLEALTKKYGNAEVAQRELQTYLDQMHSLSVYLVGEHPGGATTEHEAHGLFEKIGKAWRHRRGDPIVRRFGAAEEFRDPRYLLNTKQIRFDDYPFEWLQYPERMLASAKQAGITLSPKLEHELVTGEFKTILPVSARFFNFGNQQSGPFRRMLRDLGQSTAVYNTHPTILDVKDEKAQIETAGKAYPPIVGYQGPEVAAMYTLLQGGGSLLAEATKPGYDLFEHTPGSSDISTYVYSDFKAKSADEIHTKLETWLRATHGKPENTGSPAVEALYDAIKRNANISEKELIPGIRATRVSWEKLFLGGQQSFRRAFIEQYKTGKYIERWVKELDERIPLGVWVWKLRWVPPIFLGLLIAYAFVEIKNTTSGDKHR